MCRATIRTPPMASGPTRAYPPTYYPTGGALLRGLTWGLGFAAAGAMFGGWNWGYGGSGSYMNVNASRAANIDRNFNRDNVGTGGRWQHQVDHRKGVAYRDQPPASNTGRTGRAPTSASSSAGRWTLLARGGRPAAPAVVGRPGGRWPRRRSPWRRRWSRWRGRPGGGGRARGPAPSRGGAGGGGRPGGVGGAGGAGRSSGRGGGARRRKWPPGVNRGQQVDREAQRGGQQQQRAAPAASGGGGGRGRRGGGGGASRAVAAGWRWRTSMSNLFRRAFLALALCCGLAAAALAQAPQQPPQLRGFPTAEAAADALTDAIRKNDDKAMMRDPGLDLARLRARQRSDDDEARAKFLKGWDESHKIMPEGGQGVVSAPAPPAGCADADRQAGQRMALTTSRQGARKCRRA